MDELLYKRYIAVLERELLPAMGCTEPIAIAYASAIGSTLIFCGFGLLWRKVFKIDEKLKEIYGDYLESACTFANEV
ncbi:MAG: hypothetical protein K2H43_01325 [Clostridia bacterium]|nr:hypothetical protein [Clostridia bacterium]